ncbi:hypothetical protein [Tsuneonella troitsensis]|uniref:hypothetical protein n=1 Tax=Tsuneonella troitsensis TaxID=292222 RepID=UPI00070E0C80|nr:hypothetical protein [Tsuneonella troitsensis]
MLSTTSGNISNAAGRGSAVNGANANTVGDQSVAVGNPSVAGLESVAVGRIASANAATAVAIGNDAQANEEDAVAIGDMTRAGFHSTAIATSAPRRR